MEEKANLEEFRKIWGRKRDLSIANFLIGSFCPLACDYKKIFLFPVIRKIYPYTALKIHALMQLYDAVQEIDAENIPGAILEMGCWRGGAAALMGHVTQKNHSERTVWLFDSFAGFPELSKQDIAPLTKGGRSLSKGDLKIDIADAEEIVAKMKNKNYRIIAGWFQEELPKHKKNIGKVALLHIDCDLYESTRYCLEELYDQVSPGGYMIFDDYFTWPGSRKAIHEFFQKTNIFPSLNVYPYSNVAYIRKEN